MPSRFSMSGIPRELVWSSQYQQSGCMSRHSWYLSQPSVVYVFQEFCPILANLGYLAANLRTFWCTFAGLNNAVVSKNWQIWGMWAGLFKGWHKWFGKGCIRVSPIRFSVSKSFTALNWLFWKSFSEANWRCLKIVHDTGYFLLFEKEENNPEIKMTFL